MSCPTPATAEGYLLDLSCQVVELRPVNGGSRACVGPPCTLTHLALKVGKTINFALKLSSPRKGVGLANVNPHVMGRATDPSGGGASYMQPMWEEPNVFPEVGLTISNPCGRSRVAPYRPFSRSVPFYLFIYLILFN